MALTPLAVALSQLLSRVPLPPSSERVSLTLGLWRVLAADVVATVAVPPFDNSAMDGYALRAQDVPGELVVSQRIPAGSRAAALEARFIGGLIKTNIATLPKQIYAIAGVFPWAQLSPACPPNSGAPSAFITPARPSARRVFFCLLNFP